MLKKNIINISLIFTALILLMGCTSFPFFKETEFILYSYEIVDDDGFASITLKFNISDKITLKLYNPIGINIFSEDYYVGNHDVTISLDDYRNTPLYGTYQIKTFDYNNQQIFNKKLIFDNYNITLSKIIENWWSYDNVNYLVGFSITIENSGDLPAYPHLVNAKIGNKKSTGFIIPNVILPKSSKNVHCLLGFNNVITDSSSISLTVEDFEGKILSDSSEAVFSSKYLTDLQFSWSFNGFNRLTIPNIDFLYDYYTGLDRIILEDYTAYIFDIYDDTYIDFVAEQLLDLKDISNNVSLINFIASFIQNLEYSEDDENDSSCEYPRYPVEMLIDSEGDCEDKAMLTATILDSIGFNVSLIRLPNHMAVGVFLNEDLLSYDYYVEKYYYLETTRRTWSLGKIPEEYEDETNITVYPLSPRPILFHEWLNATRFSTTDGSDYVKIKIIIENFGSMPAYNFKVIGAFFDKNGFKFNEETTSISLLEPGDKKLITLKIDVPLDFQTTLKTQIYLNDKLVNEKLSSSLFP